MSKAFDEKELIPKGQYYKIPGPGFLPKYSTPVTPKENFRLALEGKQPYWLPDYFDITTLCPACYPDAIARGFVMGAEGMQFMEDEAKGGPDAFGIDWEYVPMAGGSMVRPGKPYLNEISEWKEKIPMPDVDSWDWAGSAAANRELLAADDGLLEMWIFTGYFERLISFLDFENAAVAMIDEDYEEDVHELFDRLTEIYKKIARHYRDDFGCDVLYFHDDWGSQRAPFFSVDTCMDMIVPHLKELVEYVHSLGMLFEMHSCGKNEPLVPCYLEAGIDIWAPQEQNDTGKIMEAVGGKFMIGLWGTNDPKADDATAYASGEAFGKEAVRDYVKHPVYHCNLFDIHEKWREGMYAGSRKALS